MRLTRLLTMAALVPAFFLIGCGAQPGAKTEKAPAEKAGGMSSMPAGSEASATAEMITCPVSGHKVVAEKAYTIDYEGKKIAFCCGDCEAPFRAEPAKYMAAVEKGSEGEHGHGH